MNLKPILLLLILFTSTKVIAQREILNLPINYKSDFYKDKESLAIINENELVLYIEDYKTTKLKLVDGDFKVKSEFDIEPLPRSFKNYLGYIVKEDNSYSIFFSNLKHKKFGRLDFNFETKESSVHKLDLDFGFEGFIETLVFKNRFYLITLTNRSNDIHFYTYEDNGDFEKKTITLDFLERKVNGVKKRASNLISNNNLAKIDITLPNAIESTSNENKVYLHEEDLIFTFDNDKRSTIIVYLNPTNFNIEHDTYKHSEVIGQQFSKHNSYIYDYKLFQISSSSDQMKFTVKDLKTKELIKEIVLNKSDSITFKNTPIIQEWGASSDKRKELEKTNKFLRKISRDKIGVSVHKQNNDFKILLGGEVINTSGGSMPGFGGIPIGSIGPLSVSFNPTFLAYGNYSSSNSTYINCLFDENFTHVEGKIEKNYMDRVKEFEGSFVSKNIYAPKAKLTNLFSFKNKLYFGYINTEDKNYHLVEFDK